MMKILIVNHGASLLELCTAYLSHILLFSIAVYQNSSLKTTSIDKTNFWVITNIVLMTASLANNQSLCNC